MPTRTLGIITSVLTIVVLLLLGATLLFGLMVMLNGFSSREAGPALLTSLACQGAALILAAVLAGRLASWLVDRRRWHGIVSVIAAVFAGTALFVGASMASIILSVIVAETLWRS
jgi:hypothetical protein